MFQYKGIAAAILGILLICAIVHFFKAFKNRRTKEDKNIEECITEFGSSIPQRYRYSDVKKMTKSFKYELGKGGFGSVYKGILSDNRLVAVKLLNSSKGTGEDFINEVASIGRTSHVNVVALLGFCYEGKNRALIYEFMPNGSLDKFIYREIQLTTEPSLGWKILYNITLGIARGLEYLHRGCSTRILHLDIKPHNILLDQEFCPKISDFGLAKVYSGKESIVSMRGGRGTFGYAAPEVGNKNFGGVSHKSDVYSYGVMVLEMVGGRKNFDIKLMDDNPSQIVFLDWIYKRVELNQDLSLHGEMTGEETQIAKKMIIVAFWCMQQNPSQRPSTNKVIEMLEGNLDALQLPPKP